MNALRIALSAAALAAATTAFFACSSTSGGSTESAQLSEPDKLDCVCGQPDGDLIGCHHPACVSGQGNPSNQDCVCGGLAATAGGDVQFTSTGEAGTSRLLGGNQILYLAKGGTVRGRLVSDDGASIQLEGSDGQKRIITYQDLDPRSVYRLMKGRTSNDDAEGQIEVGNYARDAGYYAHARRHYNMAVKADPSVQERVDKESTKLREVAGDAELARAREAASKGDLDAAEGHLSNIINEFPDGQAAATAATMLQDLQARDAAGSSSAPDTSAEIAKELKQATDFVAKAKDENRKGLLNSKKQSTALRSFDKAADYGEKARKSIEKKSGEKDLADDPAFTRAASALDRQAVDVIVDASLNSASLYMTRESYGSALAATNRAIATDPNNQQARSTRARIEVAASSNDYGGWGRPVVIRR